MNHEFGVYAKEVALHLDIETSTLRKWCIALEKYGYEFERNEKEQRIFYHRDILALSELKTLLKERYLFENAAKAVATKYLNKKNAARTLSVIMDNSEKIALSREELSSTIY